MTGVHFEAVWKLFGTDPAVADLSLEVVDGEFLVFVGPSGCGKTTSLRMLAGLERPTYGRILIGDQLVNNVPPGQRDISMVFQSYALYPHMSVYKNLAFGPRVRREGKAEIKVRVAEVAETLGITELLQRRPAELSGGQRQRVALGRALIRRPKLFLMDEPLSNLDAALRVQMRAELIRLHRQVGITTVYVTHDQVEAMTMGSRIAVMKGGILQQVAAPDVLYDAPANQFVATFIGSPTMNLIEGELVAAGDHTEVRWLDSSLTLPPDMPLLGTAGGRQSVMIGIRPSDLRWAPEAPPGCTYRVRGIVDIVEPLGPETYVTVKVGSETLVSRFPARARLKSGDAVELAVDPHFVYLFDRTTGTAVLDRSILLQDPGILAARTADGRGNHDVPIGLADTATSMSGGVHDQLEASK